MKMSNPVMLTINPAMLTTPNLYLTFQGSFL